MTNKSVFHTFKMSAVWIDGPATNKACPHITPSAKKYLAKKFAYELYASSSVRAKLLRKNLFITTQLTNQEDASNS